MTPSEYSLRLRRVVTLDEVERAGAVAVPEHTSGMHIKKSEEQTRTWFHQRTSSPWPAGTSGRWCRWGARTSGRTCVTHHVLISTQRRTGSTLNAHVDVGVHVVDRARDLRKRLSHERVCAVDLALRDDRVRLKVRDREARAAVGAVVSHTCPRFLISRKGREKWGTGDSPAVAVLRLVPARGVLELARLAVPRLTGTLAERAEGVRACVADVRCEATHTHTCQTPERRCRETEGD